MPKTGVGKLIKENSKDNNKKDNNKKKKSIFGRIIKTILIILLIAIIGYACYFAYNYFRHTIVLGENKVYDPLSATALGIDPNKLKEVGRLNILVLGESDANQGGNKEPYYLTDTIMIVSYNPQTQQASILSIPRDTYVGKRNKETASSNYLASYKMNAVYRNRTNIEETLQCVNNITGLEINNYLLVDTEAIAEIVDAIGGVKFNVPIDMDYEDLNQNLFIHLKAGEQIIDGNKAEQLLRFRHNQDGTSYPQEYGDNDIGRMRTQREFIQETAKQLLRIENATKVVNLLDIVFKNVRTNLNLQDMKYYIPYAFKFNTSNIITDVLPGKPEKCNGIWIYTVDKIKTKQVIEDLFTDKIVVEENNTQNIENTETNTVIDTNITNTVANTTLKTNTENSVVATNTNTTNESKKEQITIELLNGTKNNEIFSKIKEKLQQAGYTISKSGTTTQTKKTTVVNRTNQKSATVKEIKNILVNSIVNNGSDNSKVDFTIIIGEDCL